MKNTMAIDSTNRRVYMAGLSLAQFIGYESTMDFCGHTALIVADINTDEILYFSSADCGTGEVIGAAGAQEDGGANPNAPQKWSAYWKAAAGTYVPAEHRAQVERFYGRRHIMNLYERGVRLDSMEYPCIVNGTTRWVRTTYQLEPMETGHIQVTAAVIDISRYRDKEQQLTRKATHDGLTGLINRITAQEQITAALAAQPEDLAAIAVIDIDSFKQTNDRYGHEYGDRILLSLADELQAHFASDVVISRTGGDEFLLYLPHTTQEEAEQIFSAFADVPHAGFTYEGETVHFYVSLGYCMFPAQAREYDKLAVLADEAMYAAKVSRSTHHMQYDAATMPESRAGLGFSLRDLAEGIPGAVLILESQKNGRVLFANEEAALLFGCEDLDDFRRYTGGRAGGLVHPADIEAVRKSVTAQFGEGGEKTRAYAGCRILTKAGAEKHTGVFVRCVPNDHYGEVLYLFVHEREDGAADA